MNFVVELLISLFLIVSGVFGFVGSYGLIKLKNSVQRLHAPTKATTLGVGGVLIASMLFFFADTGQISIHEKCGAFVEQKARWRECNIAEGARSAQATRLANPDILEETDQVP